MSAAFAPGDRVYVYDDHRHSDRTPQAREWVIEEEDTNCTPVLDPEPAYRLRSPSGHVRYAYESCLSLVVDILAADGEEEGQVGSDDVSDVAASASSIQERA